MPADSAALSAAGRPGSGLVCGISQVYLAGYLDGLGASTATAVLAPRPGSCCVEPRATTAGR